MEWIKSECSSSLFINELAIANLRGKAGVFSCSGGGLWWKCMGFKGGKKIVKNLLRGNLLFFDRNSNKLSGKQTEKERDLQRDHTCIAYILWNNGIAIRRSLKLFYWRRIQRAYRWCSLELPWKRSMLVYALSEECTTDLCSLFRSSSTARRRIASESHGIAK